MSIGLQLFMRRAPKRSPKHVTSAHQQLGLGRNTQVTQGRNCANFGIRDFQIVFFPLTNSDRLKKEFPEAARILLNGSQPPSLESADGLEESTINEITYAMLRWDLPKGNCSFFNFASAILAKAV